MEGSGVSGVEWSGVSDCPWRTRTIAKWQMAGAARHRDGNRMSRAREMLSGSAQ